MSKPKFRSPVDICADCSAPDPCWASVNRGVYICNECAGIHRNLGRHVSQVKHTQKGSWHQNQLNMVHQLAMVGANSIWEHSLLDPAQLRSGKRKPNPSDSAHSVKTEFIKAKYEQLMFVHRPPRRDDDDLGKQLHSSVRTANLDTSLRLLSLGAYANYFHNDRGNTPLHVAAKAGQALQVELLVTYGADPAGLDANKQTPEDLARAEGHNDLADRLVELQYELSDRLSSFVWNIAPDHKTKKHYAISKTRDNGVGADGRKRLQALSNQIFEELAMDVYDEVDRRETEKVWQELKQAGGKIAPTADHVAVPFLPVNPEYSTTRNQGRQKLARFNQQEFNVLISDVLHDIVRRQSMSVLIQNATKNVAVVPDAKKFKHNALSAAHIIRYIHTDGTSYRQHICAASPSPRGEDPIYDVPPDGNLDYESIEESAKPRTVPMSDFVVLQRKLSEAEEKVTKLTELNRDLSNKVTSYAKQNHELLKQKQYGGHSSAFKPTAGKPPFSSSSPVNSRIGNTNGLARPTSVFDPNQSGGSPSSMNLDISREQRRRTIHETQSDVSEDGASSPLARAAESPETESKPLKNPLLREPSPPNSDYDNNSGTPGSATESTRKGSLSAGEAEKQTSKGTGSDVSNSNENNNTATESVGTSESPCPTSDTNDPPSGSPDGKTPPRPDSLPKAQDVIKKTEAVTKVIHNLLQAAQKGKIESYASCAGNILTAVQEIIALFPEDVPDPQMQGVISKLGTGAQMLLNRCQGAAEQGASVSPKEVTEGIIKNAYEIAKAEKELVTMTNKMQPIPPATPTST